MSEPTATNTRYLFDNADALAVDRMRGLAAVFDPGTFRHLTALGVGAGWRCLEVGGGGGSVAHWLSEQVGPQGHVLVTDIDTRYLGQLTQPNVTVQQHDVTQDPLPPQTFDLIHIRLVLLWLPQREQVLARLVAALKPGGWLLAEEFDAESLPPDTRVNPAEQRLQLFAIQGQLMAAQGADRRTGRRLLGRLEAHGLVHVDAEGRVFFWRGGSAGAQVLRANYLQLRPAIVAAGLLDEPTFARELAVLDDPTQRVISPVLWAVWGQKPGAGDSGDTSSDTLRPG